METKLSNEANEVAFQRLLRTAIEEHRGDRADELILRSGATFILAAEMTAGMIMCTRDWRYYQFVAKRPLFMRAVKQLCLEIVSSESRKAISAEFDWNVAKFMCLPKLGCVGDPMDVFERCVLFHLPERRF